MSFVTTLEFVTKVCHMWMGFIICGWDLSHMGLCHMWSGYVIWEGGGGVVYHIWVGFIICLGGFVIKSFTEAVLCSNFLSTIL